MVKAAPQAVKIGISVINATLLGVLSAYFLSDRFSTVDIVLVFIALLAVYQVFHILVTKRSRYIFILSVILICVFCLSLIRTKNIIAARESECRVFINKSATGSLFRIKQIKRGSDISKVAVASLVEENIQGFVRIEYPSHVDLSFNDIVLLETPSPFEAINCDIRESEWFSYEHYLFVHHIYIQSRITNINVLYNYNKHNSLFSYLKKLAEHYESNVLEILPSQFGALVVGMTSGSDRAISDRSEDIFKTLGITHIVVLSGYNISLVIDGIYTAGKRFLRMRWLMVAGLCGVILFIGAVGMSSPLLRAFVMAFIAAFARFVYRPVQIMRIFGIALFAIALLSPVTVMFDLSFLLSVFATLGVIGVYPSLRTFLFNDDKERSIARIVGETFLVSISVQLATLPLILVISDQISIISPFINILLVPLIPLCMIIGPTLLFLLSLDKGIGMVFVNNITLFGDVLFTFFNKASEISGAAIIIPETMKQGIALTALIICLSLMIVTIRSDYRTHSNPDL